MIVRTLYITVQGNLVTMHMNESLFKKYIVSDIIRADILTSKSLL